MHILMPSTNCRRTEILLLEPGIGLVDDCTDGTSWKGAIRGYRKFVQEKGVQEQFYMGFGVVKKGNALKKLDWMVSEQPEKETHYFFRKRNAILW